MVFKIETWIVVDITSEEALILDLDRIMENVKQFTFLKNIVACVGWLCIFMLLLYTENCSIYFLKTLHFYPNRYLPFELFFFIHFLRWRGPIRFHGLFIFPVVISRHRRSERYWSKRIRFEGCGFQQVIKKVDYELIKEGGCRL